MHRGYIKAWRAMADHHLWRNGTPEQKCIIFALLWLASYKENSWVWKGEKFTVQPGQMITSLESIREKAGRGVSIRNVRTCLALLEKHEFLTNETTKQGRLITITNWVLYQSIDNHNDKVNDKQVTNDRQTTDKQVTTIKNVRIKECKNSKNTSEDGSVADGADATAPTPPKRPPTSYIQEFGDWYRDMYSKLFGKPFIVNWKRDAPIIKTLYEGCDKNMEELKSRAQCFLSKKTWPENDKSLKHLLENINRLEGKGDGGRDEIDYDEAARPKKKGEDNASM
jgi:hypothetical protein